MAPTNPIQARRFTDGDTAELLDLMKGLAVFEGYIDRFAVTEDDLRRHGLGPNPRFEAYVAQESDTGPLLGTAVIYVIPWTYDLKPTLVLKELFVAPAARGRGVGKVLMQRVGARAAELDAPRLIWTVLKTNDPAASFYKGLGAVRDGVWDSWALDDVAIGVLARSTGPPDE